MPTHANAQAATPTHTRTAYQQQQLPLPSRHLVGVVFAPPSGLYSYILLYIVRYIHIFHFNLSTYENLQLEPRPPAPCPLLLCLLQGMHANCVGQLSFLAALAHLPPPPRSSTPLQTANLPRLKAILGCHMAKFNAVTKRGRGERGRR